MQSFDNGHVYIECTYNYCMLKKILHSPCSVNHRLVLDVGESPHLYVIQIPSDNRTVHNARSIVNIHITKYNGAGSNERVPGNMGHARAELDGRALTVVQVLVHDRVRGEEARRRGARHPGDEGEARACGPLKKRHDWICVGWCRLVYGRRDVRGVTPFLTTPSLVLVSLWKKVVVVFRRRL